MMYSTVADKQKMDSDNDDKRSCRSESEQEVNQSYDDFKTQIKYLVIKLKALQEELKEEKSLSSIFQNRVKVQNEELSKHVTNDMFLRDFVQNLKNKIEVLEKDKNVLQEKLFEALDKVEKSEKERNDSMINFNSLVKEKDALMIKMKSMEDKLYKRGQSDQTIHLNRPKDELKFNSKWGVGYNNPHYLKKALKEVPTLYEFEYIHLCNFLPQYKMKWTKSSDEVEMQEDLNRKNTTKMQLPFAYEALNENSLQNEPNFLSNDYFKSYSDAELHHKPAECKVYVPPLVLETKIVQLEKDFEKEKSILLNKIKDLESKNPVSVNSAKLEDIPETDEVFSDTTSVNSDVSSCKAFMGNFNFKGSPKDFEKSDEEKECIKKYNEFMFSKSPCKSESLDEDSLSDIDFSEVMNSSVCLNEEVDNFDFTPKSSSHLDFLDQGKESDIPVIFERGESSKTYYAKKKTSKSSPKRKKTGKSNSKKKIDHNSNSSDFQFSGSSNNSYKRFGVKQVWRVKSDVDKAKINDFSKVQIRPFVDGSHNHFKKVKMVWRKKSTTDDCAGNKPHKSPVVDPRSFVSKTGLPCFVYTTNQLISLSKERICCSTCGTSDFANRRYDNRWYGTYSIPDFSNSSFKVKANLRGPIKRWVPKSF